MGLGLVSIGKDLWTTVGLSTTTSNPIVGEVPVESAALTFGDNDFLTTGALQHGESGDAGGLGEFACEGWFKLRIALPGSTIDLMRGPPGGGVGAVQWRMQLTATGAVQAVMRTGATGATTYTATSSTLLALGSWYHLLATVTTSFLRVYIDGVQVASTAVGGDMPFIDGGGEMRVGDSGMVGTGTEMDLGRIAFYRSGLAPDRVLAHYQAGRLRGLDSQLPGERITSILSSAGVSTPRRLGTGVRSVIPIYMQGQNPLDEIRNARNADSVDAMFFTARDGTLTFLADGHRAASPYNTIQATFDDDGTDLFYIGLDLDYSESFLANEWNSTRPGENAETQTVSDSASIARYWTRSKSLNPPVLTDADALTIASAMLAKYKDPMTRITSLELTTHNPDVTEAIFRRDLGDRIRVFRTPPGGGARIDQTLFIQKIEISASNDGAPWRVRWGVSPL